MVIDIHMRNWQHDPSLPIADNVFPIALWYPIVIYDMAVKIWWSIWRCIETYGDDWGPSILRSPHSPKMGLLGKWWLASAFLVGFFHILGIITPTDFYIFQRGRYTTNQFSSRPSASAVARLCYVLLHGIRVSHVVRWWQRRVRDVARTWGGQTAR